MPIEAVVEAEAENKGRKREQSLSKKDTDLFYYSLSAYAIKPVLIPSLIILLLFLFSVRAYL